MPVTYSVQIKDSAANIWEFEKVADLAWETRENDVGKCRIQIPYNDTKLTSSSIQSGRGEIRIYRNGTLRWQGLIAVPIDNKDGTTIYGFDFMESLKWYRCPEEAYDGAGFDYTTKKIGTEIISPIWNIIAARTNPILGTLIQKGTIEDPYTVGTSTAKTISKTTVGEDFFSLLKEMVALSRADSPSGSWKQDTAFAISLSESAPTFSFTRDVGSDKADVRFELDSEITNFTYVDDTRYLRNNIIGYTITENPSVLTSNQVNTTSRDSYYLREISPVFGLADKQTALDEHTKDFLKENESGTTSTYLQFASGLVPFDGYSMGDALRVIINRGRVSIDDYYKVYGMVVNYRAGTEFTVPLLRRKRT